MVARETVTRHFIPQSRGRAGRSASLRGALRFSISRQRASARIVV
jgi:hypothetical protein